MIFLKCNFDYDANTFWQLNNLKNYGSFNSGRKWGPLLFFQASGFDKKPIIGEIYKNIGEIYKKENVTFYDTISAEKNNISVLKNTITLKKNDISPVRLKRRFYVSDHTIQIINQVDGVKLYKKGKEPIDLKEALLKYYDSESILSRLVWELSKDLGENPLSPRLRTGAAVWAAIQCAHPTLKKKSFNLLLNSTILAVWDARAHKFNPLRFFDEDEQKESYYFNRPIHPILIGLARDERTKEIFHWVIDLGRDLEVLFEPKSCDDPLFVDKAIQTDSLNLDLLQEQISSLEINSKEEPPYVYDPKAEMDWN